MVGWCFLGHCRAGILLLEGPRAFQYTKPYPKTKIIMPRFFEEKIAVRPSIHPSIIHPNIIGL